VYVALGLFPFLLDNGTHGYMLGVVTIVSVLCVPWKGMGAPVAVDVTAGAELEGSVFGPPPYTVPPAATMDVQLPELPLYE